MLDQSQQFDSKFNNIALQQTDKLGSILSSPLDLSNDATEKRLIDLGNERLAPKFAQDEEALRTRLSNSGLQPGSAAWNAEMASFGQTKNDATDQLILQGHGQAVNEAIQQRQEPINEITALMNGGQLTNPSFVNTPSENVAGTDVAGIINQNYSQQLQAAQMKAQSQNALMGGLFGLAGAATKFLPLPSDRRLKTDIHVVGKLDNGLSVYSYKMKAGGPSQIGLMADEVRELHPAAVITMPSGFDAVYYDQAVR